jgi:hypothetical protein
VNLHIVFLEDRTLITKRPVGDWREFQNLYADFKTSLGPWTAEQVIDFVETEYPGDPVFNRARIETFLASSDINLVVEGL